MIVMVVSLIFGLQPGSGRCAGQRVGNLIRVEVVPPVPGGRGRRRAVGSGRGPPVPPRGSPRWCTPCARCCLCCCARAGGGARSPLSPPACRGERAQEAGRAGPWPCTARRSAASPTLPSTASSSVSSEHMSGREVSGCGGGLERAPAPVPRGLSASLRPSAGSARSRPPSRTRGWTARPGDQDPSRGREMPLTEPTAPRPHPALRTPHSAVGGVRGPVAAAEAEAEPLALRSRCLVT
jgi:hypothetical protein